jgi:hypothetical protein
MNAVRRTPFEHAAADHLIEHLGALPDGHDFY